MSSNHQSDQNLLCGVIALQMDFVDRDQLVAAMNSWVIDKTKPLLSILEGQEIISAETRSLLEALVTKHLEIHGGNIEASLAAVSSAGWIRAELTAIDDPQLQLSIQHLRTRSRAQSSKSSSASGSSDDSVDSTIAYTSSDSGERFRILRPHAHGGLGEVLVARDTELNREVALKRILPSHADDPESRARFTMEGEVTGGLEHPGIVPVYGLGQYSDGQPFYAMRFVRGHSLKDAIDSFHKSPDADFQSVRFRQLLGRFVDVCNAIHYAHSRGVLHRDLKPGNIMLGKYGETLVVDWGLAKVIGRTEQAAPNGEGTLYPESASGSAPTQMGSAIGTPAYMSPEQAAGRLELLDPKSDVYSLGATLYCLLTGVAPFAKGDIGEVLRDVQKGHFASPRSVNSNVPRQLEAICFKAMSSKRDARYVTPDELANDVERYMADEPVTAFTDPLAVKVRRWIRRHQTLAVSSIAAATVLIISVAVFALVVQDKNVKLHNLNGQLDQQNEKLSAANQLALASEEDARLQANLALDTLTSIVFDVQTEIQSMSGSGEVRRRVLQKTLAELKNIAAKYVSAAEVDHTRVSGLVRLGDVIRDFDLSNQRSPGGPTGSELDDYQKSIVLASLELFDQAYKVVRPHAVSDGADPKLKRDMVFVCSRLCYAYSEIGNLELALHYAKEARTQCSELLNELPQDPRSFDFSADSRNMTGHVFMLKGDIENANKNFREAFEFRTKSLLIDPENTSVRWRLGYDHKNLAFAQFRSGNLDSALDSIRSGRKVATSLSKLAPADLDFALLQLETLELEGLIHQERESDDEAESVFREQMEVASRLNEEDDTNLDVLRYLSNANVHLGDLYLKKNKLEAASKLYERNFQIDARLAALNPDGSTVRYYQSIAQERLGDLQRGRENYPQALMHYRLASGIVNALVEENEDFSLALRHKYVCAYKVGYTLWHIESWSQSADSFREAAAILDEIIAASHPVEFDPAEARDQALNAAKRAERSVIAAGDWTTLKSQPKDEIPILLEIRARIMFMRKRLGESIDSADALCELDNASEKDLYNAARIYAICAASEELEDTHAENTSLDRMALLDLAMNTLKQAVDAGWSDMEAIQSNSELKALRDRQDFRDLINSERSTVQ